MIVVADTSPINYLVLIDKIDLLPALFRQVLIPAAVFQELLDPRTPRKVRSWIERLPAWMEVRDLTQTPGAALYELDPGEREAIALALELGVGMVLMDEARGRKIAERLQLEARGTLGILEQGIKLGQCDAREVLAKLERTTFRMAPAIRAAFTSRNLA